VIFTSNHLKKWSVSVTALMVAAGCHPPPKQMQLALASRLKIMSSLDIAERRLPQDGACASRSAARTSTARELSPHGSRREMRAPRAR